MDLVLSSAELWQLCEQLAEEAGAGAGAGVGTEAVDVAGVRGAESSTQSPSSSSSSSSSSSVTAVEYLTQQVPDTLNNSHSTNNSNSLTQYAHLESTCRNFSPDGHALCLAAEANTGSGATLEYLFRLAAERLYGASLWGRALVYTAGR